MTHLSTNVDRSLSHQVPGAAGVKKIEVLREAAKVFAEAIESQTPVSRERSLAITKLEEALMWAIKSVVLEPPKDLVPK